MINIITNHTLNTTIEQLRAELKQARCDSEARDNALMEELQAIRSLLQTMTKNDDPVDALTPEQAAEILGVASRTVREWARIGKLIAIRTKSGRWCISRESAVKLKQEREANANAKTAEPYRQIHKTIANQVAHITVKHDQEQAAE